MAQLDIHLYSEVMNRSVGVSLILPQHINAWQEPPAVLYLLHGLSGDHSSWGRNSSVERYASDYNLALVMPDGDQSFYCDMKQGSDYWKFFSEELPRLIHRWFKVSTDWKKTFVAGNSMGGYGALKLALGCPGHYAAAASLSGALDIASHINDDLDELHARSFAAIFGDLQTIPNSKNDLIAALQTIEKIPDTKFYVCCGTHDYLYQDSITFRDTAAEAGLNLTYDETDGDHNWDFWDTHIQRVLEWLPIKKLGGDV